MLSTFLSEYWQALGFIAASALILMASTWCLACWCKESQIQDRLTAAYSDGHEMGFRKGRLMGINEGFRRGKTAGKVEIIRTYGNILTDTTNLRIDRPLLKRN